MARQTSASKAPSRPAGRSRHAKAAKAVKAGAPQRTQAERSAETRRKIIDATIACMAQDGVRQTTMARIAERAGVTWGAIQHHFGDKAAIVFAGVEQGLEEIAKQVAGSAVRGDTLRERVHRVVQTAWRVGYGGPAQRRAMQVFLTTLGELQGREATRHHVAHVVESLYRMWADVFGDFDIPADRLARAQRLAFALMSGLVVEVLLTTRTERFEHELDLLESLVFDVLSGQD